MTAWFAATMYPVSGLLTHGSWSVGTVPRQSYALSQPGCGHVPSAGIGWFGGSGASRWTLPRTGIRPGAW